MHFTGNQTLAISQTRAWQFLTDPEQVGKSVPGLKSIEVLLHQCGAPAAAIWRNSLARSSQE